jgi:hypothetical protein
MNLGFMEGLLWCVLGIKTSVEERDPGRSSGVWMQLGGGLHNFSQI